MTRFLSVAELKNEVCLSEVIECHRQTWADACIWNGYEHSPRFADGLMLVCSEVRAVFTLADGRELTATKGDLIYAPQGTQYIVRFYGGGLGTDVYTVNFRLRDAEGAEIRLGEHVTLLAEGAPPDCYAIAARLADTCLSPDGNNLRKHSELFAFLAAVGEEIIYRSEEYYPIRKGARLLLKEWNQNHPVSRYAEACGISETGFYQHFKAWARISPTEYRTKMRISVARSLLRNSSYRVSEIASQIGFDDPYYFSRIFKKSVGMSPRAYRNTQEGTE